MDKIREIKISFERLLKVWLSKLEFAEEDLVAEDMIWFSEIFDDFFKGSNLKELINRDGRYEVLESLPSIAFSDFLNTPIGFSNKSDRWARLKVEKLNQFNYYRQLNEFNSENYRNYNIIDIYFRVFKRLYSAAAEHELNRTRNIILSRVISTVHKVSIFEKEGFDSVALLRNFYQDVLKGLLGKREIEESSPDEEFIGTVLFKSVFYVYYLPLFNFKKVSFLRRYLLNIWIFLNGIEAKSLLDEFLNSLSEMTLSNSSYKEVDLFEIRSLLKDDDQISAFYQALVKLEKARSQIIIIKDLEDFFKFIEEVHKIEFPNYLSKNILDYFLKTEEDSAIQLYKFRAMQSLVLEYLSIVLHFKGNESFKKSVIGLKRNEQWSNHRKFFPKSLDDVLVWLILFSDVKYEMNFRIEDSFGYKVLDDIISFLFKDIVFDERSIKRALDLRNLLKDSSFLNSMKSASKDVLSRIENSNLLNNKEKKASSKFWELLVSFFEKQINESETSISILPNIFEDLISNIFEEYKEKSLIYFLSKNLSSFSRDFKAIDEFRTFVVASDLQYRRYLIPDWYSPAYGLPKSVSQYLLDNEILQFDYNFLSKIEFFQKKEIERNSIRMFIERYGKDCLFVFRNAYPDFWLNDEEFNPQELVSNKLKAISYNTYDRNSELIIIPKSSMSILYLYDGRFKSLQFLDKVLMWELVDLGGESVYSIEVEKSVKEFYERFEMSNEDLRKFFWIRIIAKTKIIIRDYNSIHRFKLNQYGK
ncbi:hypothetical protein [Peijinzhouia sedimentorum]